MSLLINNIHEKFARCLSNGTHAYLAIKKKYAINCAIEGVRLI